MYITGFKMGILGGDTKLSISRHQLRDSLIILREMLQHMLKMTLSHGGINSYRALPTS